MEEQYNFKEVEKKWQAQWEKDKIFKASEDSRQKKYYLLEMFPYPSGRIHMGHVRNYTIGDLLARFRRMQGFNVLHPMGWDAFGLPAENAAIAHNIHPAEWTINNINYMRGQLKKLGLSYDWDREIATCNPKYYQWNQWLFLKMLEKGIAYRKKSLVNWCNDCNTVLANEQVEDGLCWRCKKTVEQREMEGWFLKITDYAEELLSGLKTLSGKWPERVITMQENWIGKSIGVEVDFLIVGQNAAVKIFTTRQDTLFGATFITLAPEHVLSLKLVEKTEREKEVKDFISFVIREEKFKRAAPDTEKKGIFTGAFAINPLTQEKIPIWIANFVLPEYGTGAIMSVPAHDQRDLDFARKYDLPVKIVIQPKGQSSDVNSLNCAYTEEGIMVNSGEFNDLSNEEAKIRIADYIEEKKIGCKKVNYRLRDWGISRQRYWGTPIPVVYCDSCGIVPVSEKDLPVTLPVNLKFQKTGKSPLKESSDFIRTTCPRCAKEARRETDTMDTFFCSSWYFTRYTCPDEKKIPINSQAAEYWLSVDHYIGGIEHAILHLLYSRFFTLFLNDLNLIKVKEPFTKLLTQGMVIKDGAKMSKSQGNVVDPDEIINKYGADTARLFILFASPPERDLDWSDQGVEGSYRFINRVWRLVNQYAPLVKTVEIYSGRESLPPDLKELYAITQRTIRKVEEDIGKRLHFNTAIASLMELVNALYQFKYDEAGPREAGPILKNSIQSLVLLLAPFTPHLAEELWQLLGNQGLIANASFPGYDSQAIVLEEVTMVIQVNGKIRSKIIVKTDYEEEELKQKVLTDEKVKPWITGKEIKNLIIVPGKLVNLVVK